MEDLISKISSEEYNNYEHPGYVIVCACFRDFKYIYNIQLLVSEFQVLNQRNYLYEQSYKQIKFLFWYYFSGDIFS